MAPKRHHYLPQFYLRGFLNPNRDSLNVIKIDDGDIFRTKPLNVGCEADWNRVRNDSTTVEAHFAKIDGATSRVLRKIAEDEVLPTEIDDLGLLLYFAARISIHNPTIRNSLRTGLTNHLDHQARWWTSSSGIYYDGENQDKGKSIPYEDMKRFVDEGRFKINFEHGYFLTHESRFINEHVIPLFCKLHWSLLIAADSTENFVCSDRPAFMSAMFTRVSSQAEFAPGVMFTMPLNRRIYLYADSQGILPQQFYIHKKDRRHLSMLSVPWLNSRTIYGGQLHVYSGDLDWEIATASGENRRANSLIGKNIKDVVETWFQRWHDLDRALIDSALQTVQPQKANA